MNMAFWARVGAYTLQRLGEPSTWAGIFTVATGVGITVAPQMQTEITTLGTSLVGILLMAAREGRNKPDNPSLPTVCKGEMPDPKPVIVPPSTAGMHQVPDEAKLEADAAGVVHVDPPPKIEGGST